MVNAPENIVAPAAEGEASTTPTAAVNGTTESGVDEVDKKNGKKESEEVEEEQVVMTMESATELLNKGKRDLFCDNITQAVSALSESCAHFDKVYGEGHVKCAKSYFWYGNALLELARIENGVLGNALQGMPSEGKAVTEEVGGDENEVSGDGVVVEDLDKLTEEEKGDIREQVAEAMEEAVAAAEGKEAKETENEKENEEQKEESTPTEEGGDAETVDADGEGEESKAIEDTVDKKTADDVEAKDATEGEGEGDASNGEVGEEAMDEEIGETEDDNDDDDDDDDSLKLSWQMIDWARKLLEGTTDTEVEGRLDILAQCFLKLGENMMESSHHPDADIEFKKCIEVYQAAIASESQSDSANASLFERSLAEAYFIAGINLLNGKNFTNAANYFESAIGVIRRRVAGVEKKIESLVGDSDVIKKQREENSVELKELEELLPNMKEKLQDAKLCSEKETVSSIEASSVDSKQESVLQQAFREAEMKEAMNGGSDTAMESGPVKSINHLVKRKSPLKEKKLDQTNQDDDSTKRKADCEVADNESVSKKVKLDNPSADGAAKTNGIPTNGVSA